MRHARVVVAHRAPDRPAIRVARGETVTLGDRDQRLAAVRLDHDRRGPRRLDAGGAVRCASRARPRALSDYDTRELDAAGRRDPDPALRTGAAGGGPRTRWARRAGFRRARSNCCDDDGRARSRARRVDAGASALTRASNCKAPALYDRRDGPVPPYKRTRMSANEDLPAPRPRRRPARRDHRRVVRQGRRHDPARRQPGVDGNREGRGRRALAGLGQGAQARRRRRRRDRHRHDAGRVRARSVDAAARRRPGHRPPPRPPAAQARRRRATRSSPPTTAARSATPATPRRRPRRSATTPAPWSARCRPPTRCAAKQAVAVGGVKAMPAVRALARKLGVDLTRVRATGADGVVTMDDVKHAAADGSAQGRRRAGRGVAADRAAGAGARARGRTAAARSTLSQAGKPMRTQPPGVQRQRPAGTAQGRAPQHGARDGRRAREGRADHARATTPTSTPGSPGNDITARLVRAIVAACKAVPALNAWFDGDNLTPHAASARRHRHRGRHRRRPVRAGAAQRRHARRARRARRRSTACARRSRTAAIPASELSGYTISLSNFGMFAGRYATPVVVPPCVAIVAAGQAPPRRGRR